MSAAPAGMLAAELMQREVVAVAPETPVSELVELLVRHRIGGVPVLDANAGVLGVVSASDVLSLADRLQAEDAGDTFVEPRGLPPEERIGEESGYLALLAIEEEVPHSAPPPLFEGWRVEDIMTDAVFSVALDTPLREVAEFLVRGRIHRALVLEGDTLRGIITPFDVLRAIAS